MRRGRAAKAAFVVLVAASWCVLLLWAAVVDWHAPISPAFERHFPGADFHAIFGTGHAQDGRFHVESAGTDYSSVQSTPLDNLDAAEFPILRYRFKHFPRTLELSLLFRTAEDPGDVQTISLPWPGAGVSTFDLGTVPSWKGTIIELGFAQFATAQNVPPALGFKPFDLVGAKLCAESWRGDIAALGTDWFGAWPWSQRSVHALGREAGAPRVHSAVLVAAIGAVIAIGWCALLLGLRGRRLAAAALVCVGISWLALDIRWQSGLVQRLLTTRTVYAGESWTRRDRIVGDTDLLQAADEVRRLIGSEPTQTRMLVKAANVYELLRLIWHLSPLNAASFDSAMRHREAIPEGCLIVFYDTDAWRSEPSLKKFLARSARLYGGHAIFADGFEQPSVIVFRYHDAR